MSETRIVEDARRQEAERSEAINLMFMRAKRATVYEGRGNVRRRGANSGQRGPAQVDEDINQVLQNVKQKEEEKLEREAFESSLRDYFNRGTDGGALISPDGSVV